MSDERPSEDPDDLEAAQPQLELEGLDAGEADPELIDDLDQAIDDASGPDAIEADNTANDVAGEVVEGEIALDRVEDQDALEDLLAEEPEPAVVAVQPAEVERDIDDEPGFLAGESAPVETYRADLPTSWPDPIPVGTTVAEPTRFDGLTVTPQLVILGALATLSFLLFVTIEPTPRWLLLFVAIIAVLGTDGVLRQAWPRPFSRTEDPDDSTPYLFLPALAVIAWPMLIEHNVRGYLVIPAAILAGTAFTAMLAAQVSSVRDEAPVYPLARLASTAAVYFTAFALFSLSYVLDPQLPAAIAAVAVIAAMLGVELFREGQVDPLETLVFAGVTGVILAEARWAMYYVPVGGYLAGLALLLGFFLVTGLLHSHLTRRLNNVVALEYAGIAAAGVLLVSIAGQAGLG